MYFLRVCCYIPFLVSDFIYLDSLFLSVTFDKGLSILLIFFKEPTPSSIDSLHCFLVSILLIPILRLIIPCHLVIYFPFQVRSIHSPAPESVVCSMSVLTSQLIFNYE